MSLCYNIYNKNVSRETLLRKEVIIISKFNLNFVSLNSFDKVVKFSGTYLCFKDGVCKFYEKDDKFLINLTDILPWEEEYHSPHSNLETLQKSVKALFPLLSNAELNAYIVRCMSIITEREENI